jgi:hypothetical protein
MFRLPMLIGFGVCSRRIGRVSADFESSCYEASPGFVKARADLTSMVLLQFLHRSMVSDFGRDAMDFDGLAIAGD